MDLLLSLVTHPMFASLLLGTAVPFLYRALEEGGLSIPAKAKTWVNLVLSTLVAFIPVVVAWAIQGVPSDPEVVFGAITTAFAVSELSYRRWFKVEKPEEL